MFNKFNRGYPNTVKSKRSMTSLINRSRPAMFSYDQLPQQAPRGLLARAHRPPPARSQHPSARTAITRQPTPPPKITFTIQTTKYLYNISSSLKRIIEEMGFTVYIMNSQSIADEIKNNEERTSNIYLFLCIGHIFDLPKRSLYCIYNLEQVNYYADFPKLDLDGKRGEFMIKAFKKSLYMFDYSKMNISNYPEYLKKKAIYLPIPLFDNKKSKTGVINNKKECDILFFGGMNERRQK